MRHTFLKILSLALCAAMFCALPAAAKSPLLIATRDPQPARLGVVRVWGAATRLESGSLRLENSNESDPNHEIIVHISGETIVLDAVTGDPMNPDSIRDGDSVYAWVGPAMTLSLPPQSTARIVVANIPADFGAPQYYEVATSEITAEQATLTTLDGTTLTVPASAKLTPFLTRNIVTLHSLMPGARILVWRDMGGTVSKVMVFAYAYRGFVSWEDGISVSGQKLDAAVRDVQGQIYLPVRAVAEAAGYQVRWDAELGAVVEYAGEVVFSTRPDTDTAKTPDGDRGLTAPCRIADGVTYFPARDLADLLDLFWS